MQIGIIGSGHVGLVTGACFAERGHKILCVDNDKKRIESLKKGSMPFYEPEMEEMINKNTKEGQIKFTTSIKEAVEACEVLFISVSTPSEEETGALDMSAIDNVCREIAINMNEYKLIVEKSTVPVQTGEKVKRIISKYIAKDVPFDVASNPEFLREGTAIQDTLYPERIVVGVGSKRAEQLLKEIYKDFKTTFVVTDIKSAELIKHSSNAFLAMKISFINAVANICELSGADIEEVANGMGLDSRIGRSFLNAGIGYGGSCFPKDVRGFIAISEELGYNFNLLKEVQHINLNQQDKFIAKIEKELWVTKNKTIGVWGLSFKPDTDDIREAPAIYIIKRLIEKGAIVRAYDPAAMDEVSELIPEITMCDNPLDAIEKADCLLLCTEWNEFKEVDLNEVKKRMVHPTIIDGRNMFNPEEIKKLGFTYVPTGKPAINI